MKSVQKPAQALFLLLGAGLAAADGTTATATLRATAVVSGPYVQLRDIADVTAADADVSARLGAVRLARAPVVDTIDHLARADVARLLARAGFAQVSLSGAKDTAVSTAASELDFAALAQAAEPALRKALGSEGAGLQLEAETPVHAVRVPAGKASLTVRPFAQARLARRLTVTVDVRVGNDYYRAVPVSFRATLVKPVWAMRADLPAGRALGCESLVLRTMDAAQLAGQPFDGACEAASGRLRRSKRAGEAVLADEVEAMPAVVQGSEVDLTIRDGAVLLESRATALADGRLGERVPVRAALAAAPVSATVVATGHVEMEAN
jgi:flagella basal body P-ring formation protein FlgA